MINQIKMVPKDHKKHSNNIIGESLGEGAYGKVYSYGEDEAMKRNLVDKTNYFMGSIREADILLKLKNHPYIVTLKDIKYEIPPEVDDLSPVKCKNKYKDDEMFFIFEKANFDGKKFYRNKKYEYSHMKIVMVQILLALEYIHGKGYIHRDLKPGNILIFHKDDDEAPIGKICDFGLSVQYTKQKEDTKKVITSWYRPPEMQFAAPYDQKADVWSLGCIFYQFIKKKALYNKMKDNNQDAINHYVKYHPTKINKEYFEKLKNYLEIDEQRFFEKHGKRDKLVYPKLPIKRPNIHESLDLTTEQIKEFNYDNDGEFPTGKYDDFLSLLDIMLQFNPKDRSTSTQALNHRFFDPYRDHINFIRSQHKPVPLNDVIINIHQNKTRKIVANLSKKIYNRRFKLVDKNNKEIKNNKDENNNDGNNKNTGKTEDGNNKDGLKEVERFKWYSDRVLFQAIDMMDRFIDYCESDNYNKKDFTRISFDNYTPDCNAEYLSASMTRFYFVTCIYMSIKYFNSLSKIIDFKVLVRDIFMLSRSHKITNILIKKACNFEKLLIKEIFIKDGIYRKTLYETSDDYDVLLKGKDKTVLLEIFLKLKSFKGYTLNEIFRQLQEQLLKERNFEFDKIDI